MKLSFPKLTLRSLPAFACIAIVSVTAGVSVVRADDDSTLIEVTYLLAPAKPLPESIKAVAVIDAGVESDEERRDSRERKWQNMAADMIEAMLQTGATAGSSAGAAGPTVVDRRSTKDILAEKDMQLVGIVEGERAEAAGKLLEVDGLIMSRVKIHIDYRRSRKESIDWGGILGMGGPARAPRYRPHPGGPPRRPYNPYRRRPYPPQHRGPEMNQRTVEEISRDLTVQCSFTLVDVSTGAALVRYTPPVYQKRDKARPNFLFGGSVDAADLDPVDHFIGELVERAAREFVSMVAPVQVSYVYPVELRKDAEPAIRMMRGDDYAGAMRTLEDAFNKKQKETDALFAAGLVSEIVGERQRALDIYRQCVSLRKVDEDKLQTYMRAKDRLSEHMDRILPGEPNQLSGGIVVDTGDRRDDGKSGERRKGKHDDDDDDDRDDDD